MFIKFIRQQHCISNCSCRDDVQHHYSLRKGKFRNIECKPKLCRHHFIQILRPFHSLVSLNPNNRHPLSYCGSTVAVCSPL